MSTKVRPILLFTFVNSLLGATTDVAAQNEPRPGLEFTVPRIQGDLLSISLRGADTNSAYELFHTMRLQPTSVWVQAFSGAFGQTNFVILAPWTQAAFYRAAEVWDSDFDGLSDGFEQWVTRTSSLSPDSDADGIADGGEDANLNGLPDYVDYHRATRAVIYASGPNAFEGGGTGEATILLPTPAPAGGTTLTLHLGGTAELFNDYLLTSPDGTPVTNEVSVPAGAEQLKLVVQAVDDTTQARQSRKAALTLAGSTLYLLDPDPAEVTLLENDLPTVAVFATDRESAEPVGTITNPGEFLFVREGVIDAALNVQFQRSGTATSGADYSALPASVTFAAGSNEVRLAVYPVDDTDYEGEESVRITLRADAAYRIHPVRSAATITIKEDDVPVVSVSADGNDGQASEAGQVGRYTFSRGTSGDVSWPLAVYYRVSGTASAGADYESLPGSFTIPAGQYSAVLTVQPRQDSDPEPLESVIVTLAGSLDYRIGAANATTVTLDDDEPAGLALRVVKPSMYHPQVSAYAPGEIEITRLGPSRSSSSRSWQVAHVPGQGTGPFLVLGDGVNITPGGQGIPNGTIRFFPNQTTLTARIQHNSSAITQLKFSIDNSAAWSVLVPCLTHDRSVRMVVSGTTDSEEGNSAHQATVQVFGPPNADIRLRFSGDAVPGLDYVKSNLERFSLSAGGIAVLPLTALADGIPEGVETAILRFDTSAMTYWPYDSNLQETYAVIPIRDLGNHASAPQADADGDGLVDRFELEHPDHLHPLGFDDPNADPDGDGLSDFEEAVYDTDPEDADTDGDGQNDFVEQQVPEGPDTVKIKLRVGDTGKVADGHGCAVCHTTQLHVGDFRHTSFKHGQLLEKTHTFQKGQSYPIRLVNWLLDVPRPNRTPGSPTTTARYTAQLLPVEEEAPAPFLLDDPLGLLGANRLWNPAPFQNQQATLIVPKIELIWDAGEGNAPLESNRNPGGGLRVYPDRLSPTDTGDRRFILLHVKVTPPLPGWTVRLKAFDVDDPTPPQEDRDLIIDPTDFPGFEIGDDNLGNPQRGEMADTAVTLSVFGEAFTVFKVSLQPGDNYRVAAVLDTPEAVNQLNGLQVSHPFTALHVPASDAPVPGFVGSVSPMLTVWRKLHMEFDSMTAPPAGGPEAIYASGYVTGVRLNYPVSGRSQIALNHLDITGGGRNLFEQGKLEITGVGTYAVTKSDDTVLSLGGGSGWTKVEIIGVPTNLSIGASIKLYDDDDRYLTHDPPLYPSLLNLPAPLPITSAHLSNVLPLLKSAYRPAHIEVINANAMGWNATQTIPFRRIVAPIQTFLGGITSYFDQGNLDLKGNERAEFWAHSVVYGYQPGAWEDGENNDEDALEGGTPKWRLIDPLRPTHQALGYSIVFMEAVRDVAIGRFQPHFYTNSAANNLEGRRLDYWARLAGQTAHEVAHAPGRQAESTDHAEEGLMQGGGESHRGASAQGSQRFTPATIKRLRSATRWAE